MGNLDDFSLDQMAGATALVISSIGGLLLIVFKSRCKTINCCWGMWSCDREVKEEEEEGGDKPRRSARLKEKELEPQSRSPEPEPEP